MKYEDKITKNLGGDRLGSGAKNNISLHKYNRSTHDLSRAWRSSMTPGTLVPFLCEVALPGDSWDIQLESLIRTMPAVGPLFGSYKMQMDVFTCPIRLYNGLLHNNMTKIGLNMSQVKLPKVELTTRAIDIRMIATQINNSQIATDSLLNYLGLRGLADKFPFGSSTEIVTRKINAVPILAYYDIYKNYYANKQEETGYIITPDITLKNAEIQEWSINVNLPHEMVNAQDSTPPNNYALQHTDTYQEFIKNSQLTITYTVTQNLKIKLSEGFDINSMYAIMTTSSDPTTTLEVPLTTVFPDANLEDNTNILILGTPDTIYQPSGTNYHLLHGIAYNEINTTQSKIKINGFLLENIDEARTQILRNTGLNNEFKLNSMNFEPYKSIWEVDGLGDTLNKYHLNGLAIKTYQSDLSNNWLKTEWIDGSNGINQITAIDTSSGNFTIDALNLANKVYNMLNRIAISGGSYEDYIEAVYATEPMRRADTPVYVGGMSAEIVFEEVVSTAAVQSDNQPEPLGSLAGKGTQTMKRGGNIEISVKEPSYIIGLVSITPRLDYSQGNKWDLTELDTLEDLHKPALDGIGFENLLQERMAWWGTYYNGAGELVKLAAGKVPAWINYMTAVNETHGDFADENKTMFMTLNRRYQYREDNGRKPRPGIADMTTYIDPTKYNYSFADTNIDAQNFWVQIGIQIFARRVMSAKIMPNL